jgi:hypothetical protein
MRAYPSTVITLTIAIPVAVLILAFAVPGERAHERATAAAVADAPATTTTTGVATVETVDAAPLTASNNRVHPPPADVQLGECSTREYAGPAASGTLTNNSSKLSNYVISVNFADDTGIIVANATAFPHDVPAGGTATWEALSFDDSAFATCEIVKVDRFSAVG